MKPQRVERAPVQGDRRAIGERPAEPRGRKAEGAGLRQDSDLLARKAAGQGDPDAVPHWIAAGQYGHPTAAAALDGGNRPPDRPLPDRSARPPCPAPFRDGGRRRPAPRRSRQAHAPPERGRPCRHRQSRRRRARASPGARKGVDGRGGERAAATAAVESYEFSPRPKAASAALASTAPIKPTGKPSTSAGSGAPSARISSNRKSAVGALPIATIAPDRCGRHSSTAAAERVVSAPPRAVPSRDRARCK